MKDRLRKILPNSIWNQLIRYKSTVKSIWYYIFRVFPINNNKIVISNYSGKGFGDNGKYIALELLNRDMKIDIIWLIKKDIDYNFPIGIRAVEDNTISSIFELATAKIWIDNCRKRPEVRKRNGQYYINTGHGGIPLKKVEKDAEDNLSFEYILRAKNDSKMVDLMTSNAKFRTTILKNSYWYSGEVVECGSPKIEVLLNVDNAIIKKVRNYFNLNSNVKILLYAPTFRKSGSLEAYDIDFYKLKDSLENKFGGCWRILLRLHPNLSGMNDKLKYKESFIDATLYPDMQELLMSSDILITDYSGTMFEYLYIKNPVFLYANDIEKYDRGFYFKFSDLPFPLAAKNDELIEIIEKFDFELYKKKVDLFKKQVGLIEKFGASKTVVDIIENNCNG